MAMSQVSGERLEYSLVIRRRLDLNILELEMSSGRWIIQISFARYKIFEQRIHAKYPEIKLIGSAGPMLPQIITQMHGSSTARKRRTIQTLFMQLMSIIICRRSGSWSTMIFTIIIREI